VRIDVDRPLPRHHETVGADAVPISTMHEVRHGSKVDRTVWRVDRTGRHRQHPRAVAEREQRGHIGKLNHRYDRVRTYVIHQDHGFPHVGDGAERRRGLKQQYVVEIGKRLRGMHNDRERRRIIMRQAVRAHQHLGAMLDRYFSCRRAVRRDHEFVARRQPHFDRPRDQWLAAQLLDILVRQPLAAAARGDDAEHAHVLTFLFLALDAVLVERDGFEPPVPEMTG
jgi:hypothetical protein